MFNGVRSRSDHRIKIALINDLYTEFGLCTEKRDPNSKHNKKIYIKILRSISPDHLDRTA
ncbi:hypothetical protein LFREDSHE_48470 [Shewanella baltica]